MSKKLAIAMFGQKRLSREGGVEIVVKELCTRMAQNGCDVTCYNRAGHHVSGAEYDDAGKTEYEGIRQKSVPTIERRGLAAVSSSFFAALYSAFGKYDVVHVVIPKDGIVSFYSPRPSRHTLNVLKIIFQSTQKLRSLTYFTSRSIHSSKERSLRCGAICQ